MLFYILVTHLKLVSFLFLRSILKVLTLLTQKSSLLQLSKLEHFISGHIYVHLHNRYNLVEKLHVLILFFVVVVLVANTLPHEFS